MDNKALQERIKALKSAIDGGTLSGAQKKQARTRMKEARAELKSRREAKQAKQAKQADQGNQQNQQKDAQQVQAGAKDQGLPVAGSRRGDERSAAARRSVGRRSARAHEDGAGGRDQVGNSLSAPRKSRFASSSSVRVTSSRIAATPRKRRPPR